MWKAMKRFFIRRKQVILYFLFGAFISACALFACYLTLRLGVYVLHDEKGEPTALLDVLGSTVQWLVVLLMTFFTNRKWVFTQAEHGVRAGWRQFGVYTLSRVFTYVLEVVLNLALIAVLEALHYHAPTFPLFGRAVAVSARLWAKLISAAIVVITNYVISNRLVFRKKRNKEEKIKALEK